MANKGQKRKDNDRIVLRTGESQRPNGTYDYRWTGRDGKRHVVYAKTLEELREKEAQVENDKFQGLKAEARNVQASTVDTVHTVLHQVLQMAVDDRYISSNPSDGVLKELKKSHVFKTEKRRGLTRPEQELLLNYLKSHHVYGHWYPIFAVMIGTGLRIGEVAGLRWCDIDLDEGIIDINHTLVYYDHRDPGSKRGCYFNVHTPKTSAGVRQVPMLDFVKEAFLMEREYQQAMRIFPPHWGFMPM